jgi:type II secretory pathway pseudopilin PulG
MRIHTPTRNGFTALEAIVALGVLGTAIAFVSQLVAFGIAERRRNLAQQEAVETATNILEAARACPWDKLDDNWAAAQKLPDTTGTRLHDARLAVRVEPRALEQATLKRVVVEIEDKHVPIVRQTAWFASREAPAGGKP